MLLWSGEITTRGSIPYFDDGFRIGVFLSRDTNDIQWYICNTGNGVHLCGTISK